MTIQDAITKAVEGGWKRHAEGTARFVLEEELAVLDPLFWQALGKAMGWEDEDVCVMCAGAGCSTCTGNRWHEVKRVWRVKMFFLISHLQDGGSIESFFNTL